MTNRTLGRIEDDDDMITLARAAELTGYEADYLRRLAREGKIDGQKVAPRLWLVRRGDVVNRIRSAAGRPRKESTT